MKRLFGLFLIVFICNMSFSQELDKFNNSENQFLEMMGLNQQQQQLPDYSKRSLLISAVDESEYIVDAGDVFIIKIDVKGPAFKLFNSVVTPAGYLLVPDTPTIYVKNLSLKTARSKISGSLRKSFPNAKVEAHLYQLHHIGVDVLGAIPRPGKIILNSGDRLFDAVTFKLEPLFADTTLRFNWNTMSLRRIDIIRNKKSQHYDLLNYRLTGNKIHNPYVMDGDVVYINFKDTLKNSIVIKGAVGRPTEFEYLNGDNLAGALRFASGMLPDADSNRIEIVRMSGNTLDKKVVSFPQDSSQLLKPGDHIYIRDMGDWIKVSTISVEGEVRYPGEYSILHGKTRLSEVIALSGGFTNRASLWRSVILRKKEILFDTGELQRLRRRQAIEMSELERSFYRQRTRENRYIVNCDFNKLFEQNIQSQDVILLDGDAIVIPEKNENILVTGGVFSPGRIRYTPGWNCTDYINAAGGFSERAREGWTKIIIGRNGKWLDADDEIVIGEGDIIFVPEREDVDWFESFKDGLAVVSQVATIILILLTIK